MTLELWLLILESVLLVATVVLLAMSIKEGRGRDSLIREVGRAMKMLTRHEYFMTVTDAMMDARGEVLAAITGRLPSGEDRKRTSEIISNIERLSARGVKVRYLLPKFQDRLHIGWLYTHAGAEVRFSSCLLVHDFRYTVVDERVVIIGVPEAIGEKEATRKGYRIPAEGLASVLRKHFDGCWGGIPTFEEYLGETMAHTGATPEMLAKELKIEGPEFLKAAQRQAGV